MRGVILTIYKIFLIILGNSIKEVEDIKENNIDVEVISNENIIEIPLDNLEIFLDLSIDII